MCVYGVRFLIVCDDYCFLLAAPEADRPDAVVQAVRAQHVLDACRARGALLDPRAARRRRADRAALLHWHHLAPLRARLEDMQV